MTGTLNAAIGLKVNLGTLTTLSLQKMKSDDIVQV